MTLVKLKELLACLMHLSADKEHLHLETFERLTSLKKSVGLQYRLEEERILAFLFDVTL